MSTLKEFSNSLIFPLGDKLPEHFLLVKFI